MAKHKADRHTLLAECRQPRANKRTADALALSFGHSRDWRQPCRGDRFSVRFDIHSAEQDMPDNLAALFGYERDQCVTIDDVGGSALYLLSDLASGVTGETHHVDAGYHTIGMKQEDAPDIALA